MKPEEAIEIIEKQIVTCEAMIDFNEIFDPEEDNNKFLKEKEILLMAVQSIKEVQQYWEIGAVEECREAVEKQASMKVKIIERLCFECPSCKELISTDDDWNTFHHCPNCGQAIQWSENMEVMENEKD